MTSWMEERDRLVAQTLAFVQQVAAAHPAAAPEKTFPEQTGAPLAAEPVMQSAVVADPAPTDLAAQPIEAAIPVPPARPLATVLSERDDIMQRVAAFRARQGRIIEEREAYYEAVKAKIKTVLGNESGDGRL